MKRFLCCASWFVFPLLCALSLPRLALGVDAGALVGTWVATWPGGARQELRVDAVSPEGVVDGVFCGVRIQDRSMFFFDVSAAAPVLDGAVLRMQRGKHSYAFTAQDQGVQFVYTRRGSTPHTIVMTAPGPENEARCIGRVRSLASSVLPSAPAGGVPFTGLWTYVDEKGRATELLSSLSDEGALSGTLCYQRSDGSVALFDFAPDDVIQSVPSDGGFEVVRRPFKANMTHRFDVLESGGLRYRERVRSKPWRMDVALAAGPWEGGCLRRIVAPSF